MQSRTRQAVDVHESTCRLGKASECWTNEKEKTKQTELWSSVCLNDDHEVWAMATGILCAIHVTFRPAVHGKSRRLVHMDVVKSSAALHQLPLLLLHLLVPSR